MTANVIKFNVPIEILVEVRGQLVLFTGLSTASLPVQCSPG